MALISLTQPATVYYELFSQSVECLFNCRYLPEERVFISFVILVTINTPEISAV